MPRKPISIEDVYSAFPEGVDVGFPDTVIGVGVLEELCRREVEMRDLILSMAYPCSLDPIGYTIVGNPVGPDMYF